ncbi:sulfotransferase [bacterium]|nr:sulfotransferase [bacterium]
MNEKNEKLNPSRQEKIFFIVGRGRSGTWLLQSILDHHPQICVAPEAVFMLTLYRKYRRIKHWTDKKNESLIKDLGEINRVNKWLKLDWIKFRKMLSELPSNSSFEERCKLVYKNYAEKMGKKNLSLLGDKMPTYSLFLEELCEIIPQAIFIHMIRDPRDTVISYKKVHFDLNNTVVLAQRWCVYNRYILSFKQKNPQRFITLKYEDFLHNPEKQLRRLCVFMNLPYDTRMLEFHKKPRNILVWNEDIASPIQIQKAYKWNHHMERNEAKLVDYTCRGLAEKFGYEVSDHKIPFYLKIWVKLGKLVGWISIKLERGCFRLPFRLQVKIVNKLDPLL